MSTLLQRLGEWGGKPLSERLTAWLELGIPRDALTPGQREKVQVIVIVTSAMLGIAAISVLQSWWVGKLDVLLYLVLAASAGVANLWLLHRTRRPALSGHISVAILALLISASAVSAGGFHNPSFAWLYILPLAASVSIDLRGTFCWTLATMAIVAGYWLLPHYGIELTDQTPPELRDVNALVARLLTVLSLGTIALGFGIAQRRAAAEFVREASYRQLVMHAAVAANEARSFDEALDDAVTRICAAMGWELGHVWQVGDDGTSSASGFAIVAPEALAHLADMSVTREFALGEGLPGRAVAARHPRIVTDMHSNEFGDRARVAAELGVQSAIAVPVMVHGRVRAVLEFASRSRLADTEQLLAVMAHIAVQLGRVAERTAMQDRVQQAQKMEAVGQLAAGLAHEINNPMAYVRSNLYSLREIHGARKVEGPLSKQEQTEWDDCQDLLEESIDGVERTIAIVRDVVHFSRAGGPDPASWELARVDVVLREALRVAGARAPHGVRIDIDVQRLPEMRCAPNPLRQVFVNLILNALHAVGAEGWIGLRTRVDGDEVVVRVEDDGPGLTPRDRERLFDPFFTTKPVGEGTGLGLAVSYEIVRSHGGEIRVESEPGEGAVFEVRLPVPGRAAAEEARR